VPLAGAARQQDITQRVLLEFVRRALAYLIEKRALPLTALVRWKFILAKVLAQKISQNRERASGDRYQQTLFGAGAAVETSFNFKFDSRRQAMPRTGLMKAIPTNSRGTIMPPLENWGTRARNTSAQKPSI